jgi:hypothetical protein
MVLFSRYTALFVLIIYAALAMRSAHESEQVRRLDRLLAERTAVTRIETRSSKCTIYPKSGEAIAINLHEEQWDKVKSLATQNRIYIRAYCCLDATPVAFLLGLFLFGTPTFMALSQIAGYFLARSVEAIPIAPSRS